MIDSYVAGLVVTAGLLLLGHWFRWPKGDLDRLTAYTYGVGSILAGQFVWLHWSTMRYTGDGLWWQIASFAIVGGAATGLAYFVDWVIGLWIASSIHGRPDKRS